MVLDSGEAIVGPINLIRPRESSNFIEPDESAAVIGQEILALIREVNVMSYRPSEYFPALRIETPAAIAKNKSRLSILLDALHLILLMVFSDLDETNTLNFILQLLQ